MENREVMSRLDLDQDGEIFDFWYFPSSRYILDIPAFQLDSGIEYIVSPLLVDDHAVTSGLIVYVQTHSLYSDSFSPSHRTPMAESTCRIVVSHFCPNLVRKPGSTSSDRTSIKECPVTKSMQFSYVCLLKPCHHHWIAQFPGMAHCLPSSGILTSKSAEKESSLS